MSHTHQSGNQTHDVQSTSLNHIAVVSHAMLLHVKSAIPGRVSFTSTTEPRVSLTPLYNTNKDGSNLCSAVKFVAASSVNL